MALIFLSQMAHANVDSGLLGRWQLSGKGLWQPPREVAATFTMDVVRCGDEVCAILVEGSRCGAVVLEPYAAPEQGQSAQNPPPAGRIAEYRFRHPDRKEEFVAQIHADGPQLWLVGAPIREAGRGWMFRRMFPLSLGFHRIGDAQCSMSAPTS